MRTAALAVLTCRRVPHQRIAAGQRRVMAGLRVGIPASKPTAERRVKDQLQVFEMRRCAVGLEREGRVRHTPCLGLRVLAVEVGGLLAAWEEPDRDGTLQPLRCDRAATCPPTVIDWR